MAWKGDIPDACPGHGFRLFIQIEVLHVILAQITPSALPSVMDNKRHNINIFPYFGAESWTLVCQLLRESNPKELFHIFRLIPAHTRGNCFHDRLFQGFWALRIELVSKEFQQIRTVTDCHCNRGRRGAGENDWDTCIDGLDYGYISACNHDFRWEKRLESKSGIHPTADLTRPSSVPIAHWHVVSGKGTTSVENGESLLQRQRLQPFSEEMMADATLGSLFPL